jgi:pimeloyl-ACP methyl ester carboxylesterase
VRHTVEVLARHFTVFSYDRRGRGDSGDTAPYAVEREIEDIEAVINESGGPAFVYGHSSGAVLSLEATKEIPSMVRKLALYEPPFIIDGSRPPAPADYVDQVNRAIAVGRPGDGIAIFMTQVVGIPKEFVDQMRNASVSGSPSDDEARQASEWAGMERMAHTLAYDGAIMGDTMFGKPLPSGRWAAVTLPTLVICGGTSEQFIQRGAQALVQELPNAQFRILEGQGHAVSPEVIASLLVEFFAPHSVTG